MRVLLTRPLEDSKRLAQVLRERGHAAIVSPVMEIQLLDGPEILLEGVQAILATSANGIRGLSRRTARRDLPVFAVGPQTESAAESAGFMCVRTAEGHAAALAVAVENWAVPEGGALLYAAGQERLSDLEHRLRNRGYSVLTEVLYDAIKQPLLSPEAVQALSDHNLDAAMLFSPRSARIFASQIRAAQLSNCCAGLIAFCISEAVANALEPLRFRDMRIAAHPDQDGMLALLG